MPSPIDRARRLRSQHSDAERKLWLALRDRRLTGFKFRRQHPNPPYTLDFYCAEAALVIEVDGGQHAEEQAAAADRRTAFLEAQGLLVLRIWNNEVLGNLDGCLEHIAAVAAERMSRNRPSPRPSPRKRGEGGLRQ